MAQHVLTVDDEVNIRRLVEINLQHAGYRVSTACDGQQALTRLQGDRPDLILLDVIMPHMDGFELLNQLRSQPELANIPVVMLTVQSRNEDIFRAWELGVRYYLHKPFSPAELLTIVRQALDPDHHAEMPDLDR